MNKILALWAVPRSTSTAFEWMMRQRGDFFCLHEPYGEAWYQGEDPLWPRLTKDSIRTPGLTLESVTERLLHQAKTKSVFIKDFPHYIDHMWTDELLNNFTHSFLIRHPAKTLTSMFNKWPDFDPKEVGFKEQRALYDKLLLSQEVPPPVIDSDDLLTDPKVMVERWSNAVGIPFIEKALSWEPGARDEVSWWDGGSFHANLRDSDGLKPQARSYVEMGDVPERVKIIYEQCMVDYNYLFARRIQPS